MRLRHKPWAKDLMDSHPEWVLDHPVEWRGKWHELFGNEQPLHVEIGTGKGQFIVEMARLHPTINFVGVELQESVLVVVLQKLLDDPLPNVRLLHSNGSELTQYFNDGEVDQIYLNFSDPWPKKRHAKRRLTHPLFIKTYKKILNENGQLQLKTDNRKLFEYSLVSFNATGLHLTEVSLDLHRDQDPDNVMTEYEQKFSPNGPIYRARYQFKPVELD
ncbi:tRNA (guanosine(46)-N7)-methyltransferase TrmB [Atopobacter phocae]|uniref:tRNA (guanosine(46)-N7)-methyltransferase TrmB n=1 Tax=Atopobacter phocae TaxID=136492 RepID=UPI0004718416|nr:tRNA (guanosine(46)-N7)-methyltransferase TrmB [Atopobacter phocae]